MVLEPMMALLAAAAAFPHSLEAPPPADAAPPAASGCPEGGFEAWLAERPPAGPRPERAGSHPFATELYGRIAAARAARPGLVRPRCIGTSVEGRPIWAFAVGQPHPAPAHRVLVLGNIHAMEWLGAEVAVALLEELVREPPARTEVVIVPILNPDGRALVEADLRAGRRAYRRGNAAGVDLNRDFAVHRTADNLWSRLPYLRRYYATSPAPLSQPESQAVDALAAEGIDAAVSLHAFGGFLYHPWAGRYAPPPDAATYHAIGAAMARSQPGRPYTPRQLGRWAVWFRGLGMEVDHLYGVHGAWSFLIELSRGGIRLREPSTWTDSFRWYNPEPAAPHVAAGVAAVRTLVALADRGLPPSHPGCPPGAQAAPRCGGTETAYRP